ncbi:TPA: chorismate mutase [Streptococcus suis]
MNLQDIRQDINQIDAQLVALLERRMSLVDQVTAFKRQTGKAVLDSKREEEVLKRVADLVENPAYQATIRATFADIMSQSRAYQTERLTTDEDQA